MRPIAAHLAVIAALGALGALAALAAPANAGRHAILAANNAGWATEPRLRFADDDIRRLAATLHELGEFATENVTVLPAATPTTVKAAFAATARQIQGEGGGGDLLVFFYSGHADETGLHLGRDLLTYQQLRALIEESPATVKLGLVDACHSGGLTTAKGAQKTRAFDVQVGPADAVRGTVLITAAAATEKAQESPTLGGSFFSTYINSGLLGAADANDDGLVSLAELYSYAYVMTVGRTSGTRAGIQHPTFKLDLHGRGELVLTRPRRARGHLVVAGGTDGHRYQVLRASDDAMLAELPTLASRSARIGLPGGRYKVRLRAPGGIYEQRVVLLAGETRRVQPASMTRVIVPDAMSKGELLSQTWALGIGYGFAAGEMDSTLPLHRAQLSIRAPLHAWALHGGVSVGRRTYDGAYVDIESLRVGTNLALTRDIIVPFGLLGFGPAVGYAITFQDTEAALASATSSALFVGGQASVAVPLALWRLSVGLSSTARACACAALSSSRDRRDWAWAWLRQNSAETWATRGPAGDRELSPRTREIGGPKRGSAPNGSATIALSRPLFGGCARCRRDTYVLHLAFPPNDPNDPPPNTTP